MRSQTEPVDLVKVEAGIHEGGQEKQEEHEQCRGGSHTDQEEEEQCRGDHPLLTYLIYTLCFNVVRILALGAVITVSSSIVYSCSPRYCSYIATVLYHHI